MNKKKFEVPYNFDEELIPFYKEYSNYVNFLFLPPYKDDLINTRTIIQSADKGDCYMPQCRYEYESHLKEIKDAGLRFVVLWQVKDNVISKSMLDYYVNLGAAGFIVANDDNAKIIKKYDDGLLVICSIVQRLCAGMLAKDFSNYDYVVMYYPFNRSLNAIKLLKEIKEKIVIMPNTVCHTDCPAIHHWFPSKDRPFNQDRDCMAIKNIDRCCFIYPEHLSLFDDFVGGYKLQGREYPTSIIKDVCRAFFTRKTPPSLLEANIEEKLQENLCKMTLEEYYNVKTSDVVACL
ncbi:hypothetical protein B7982_04475 [Fibrobacter sp. UWB2]|uniref:hypothetical protein n=1 Tax=Fibrobacter sp. UWB2 TaxID=1964358 RepID=UPI000B524720|nr:hypothetical protein [Fibrobacter sp. UWB2]OWV23693.1 hypothetical protein B7982_04475 [Fibrobacter sp. UWB2]